MLTFSWSTTIYVLCKGYNIRKDLIIGPILVTAPKMTELNQHLQWYNIHQEKLKKEKLQGYCIWLNLMYWKYLIYCIYLASSFMHCIKDHAKRKEKDHIHINENSRCHSNFCLQGMLEKQSLSSHVTFSLLFILQYVTALQAWTNIFN